MKKVKLVEELKKNHAAAVSNIPERKLIQIVQAIGATISRNLAESEGKIALQGLGVFSVKKKEVDKEGVKTMVTRVNYKAPVPKGERAKKPKRKKDQAAPPADE